jgi:hypothetical protein
MPRKHTLVVALSLAFAAVVGTIALTKTVHLGQASAAKPVSKAVVAKRTQQLDRFEASLRAALKRTPPPVPKKLPPIPAVSATPAVSAAPSVPAAPAPAAAPAATQRVVYVRPAPIVIHKHRAGGESEGSDHGDGGGDSSSSAGAGGGLDD